MEARKNPKRLVDWRMVAVIVSVSFLLVLLAMFAAELASRGKANYELSNLTKAKSQAIRLEIAKTDLARMRGLMFRDRIVPILFVFGYTGKFPIHSRFVIAEFDAAYLSENGTVVELFRKIPPNTSMVTPKNDATYLLELPVDVTDSLGIEEGDRLQWKEIR